MVVLVKQEFTMKKRLRLCFAILRPGASLLYHGWTFGREEICGGAMLRAPHAVFLAIGSGKPVSCRFCRFFSGFYASAPGGWRETDG